MTDCCTTSYGDFFDAKESRSKAETYRKKGLVGTARRMVDFLADDIADSTVMEVGGGVGAVQVELLRAGAARAVNVELSPEYEVEAIRLLEEAGVSERAERRIGDFVLESENLEPTDVVLMNRVICCYPDMEALVGAAAGRAGRYLAMSFPRDRWWLRLAARAANLVFGLRRVGFRTFVHSPSAIHQAAQSAGLHPVLKHEGLVWQVVVLERSR